MSQVEGILSFFAKSTFPPDTKEKIVTMKSLAQITPEGLKDCKAYDLYAKHYSSLKFAKVSSSQVVSELTDGVNHAEQAIVLWMMEKRDPVKADLAADLQVKIFKAANWLRRFAYERTQVDSWYDDEEKREAAKMSLEMKTKAGEMVEYISSKNAAVRTIVRENEANWKKEEANLQQNDPHAMKEAQSKLKLGLKKIKHNISLLRFLIRELQDCRGDLGEDSVSLIEEARNLLVMTNQLHPAPSWRTKGITELGPFGIKPVVDSKNKPILFLKADFAEKYAHIPNKNQTKYLSALTSELKNNISNGQFVLNAEHYDRFPNIERKDGKIFGVTSPYCEITIPPTDDTFKLIRIPKEARYFAWAYPIIGSRTEVRYDGDPTPMDLFLTLGGYVYFDISRNLIQCNALLPQGSQLQFSSPLRLPDEVYEQLERQKRFFPITLDFLSASHFAWINPGEFDINGPGAFAYKYGDEQETRNYFILAAVESITGKSAVKTSVEMV